MTSTLLFSLLATAGGVSAAQFGVDLSVPTTVDEWNCLKTSANVTYGIVRAYRSKGEVDQNAPTTIRAAFSAGIRDFSYAVKNGVTCSSPADQMHETIAYLESNGVHVRRHDKDTASAGEVSVGRMWLDIEDEDPSQYYDTDITVNQAAVSDLIAAAELEGVRVGIYTTKTYWNRIMGGVEGYSQYPLWYPRYDGENSMDFFEPFSGWERAAIKQTAGDAGLCGISQVDTDYMDFTE